MIKTLFFIKNYILPHLEDDRRKVERRHLDEAIIHKEAEKVKLLTKENPGTDDDTGLQWFPTDIQIGVPSSNELRREQKSFMKTPMKDVIGKKVTKKSNKPFKSGEKVNTVRGFCVHPKLHTLCLTFEEDDTYVEANRCRFFSDTSTVLE